MPRAPLPTALEPVARARRVVEAVAREGDAAVALRQVVDELADEDAAVGVRVREG